MKGIVKWAGGILAGALTMVLVIVLTPYVASFAEFLLPDVSGGHIRHAAILSEQMEDSARLETLVVTSEGAVSAEVNALIFGTVSSVNATYTYSGSFGVDLSRVTVQLSGNKLIFILPQPEVLSDSITLGEIVRSGMLDGAVRIDDKELQALLETERIRCREIYLTGEHAPALQEATIKAFENTIAAWMTRINGRIEYSFQWAAPEAE